MPVSRRFVISFALAALAAVPVVAQGQVNRCTHAACQSFQRVVPASHQHRFRCTHAACQNFQQWVDQPHQHRVRCANATCREFQRFVPVNHVHRPRQ